MQTIGVIGGIGPQATIDFEMRLHRASQRLLPQRINEGYPPMVTLFLRSQPVLFDGDRPRQPLQIEPAVLEAAAWLATRADFLVSPCNTLHHFADEIAEAAGCELLSIVDVTIAELCRRDAGRVGLLGLGIPQVYADRFRADGIEFVTLSAEERDRLDDAILRVAEGATTEGHRAEVRAAVASMRADGVATTVLGCTEIPVLLDGTADAADLVNPTELLAEAAVRRAAGC